jgi:hypothetical protein
MMPLPVSSRMTSRRDGAASTKAVPSVGWPANGNSIVGVKMRIRASASGVVGGRTNALSERFVSRVSASMVASSRPLASVNTASALPASARSVKTSQIS